MQAQFAAVGATLLIYSPGEIRNVVERDTARWAKVVKAAGIEPE